MVGMNLELSFTMRVADVYKKGEGWGLFSVSTATSVIRELVDEPLGPL